MTESPPPHRRQATIADVARRAGVSKGTVSNYLGEQVRVAPGTARRIADAIAELDYRPAEIAQSLTSRRRAGQTIQGYGRAETDAPFLTVVGHVSVDFIARLDRLPSREDRIQAHEILKGVGGPAANVAAVAAGLSDRWKVVCSLLTVVGNDVDSDWAIAKLSGRGVDILTPSGRRDGRLGRALVLVEPDGRRTIVAEPITVGDVDLDLFIASHSPPNRRWCLHFEGFQVPHQFVRVLAARAAGFRTSMHTTGLPTAWLDQNPDAIFSAFDLLIIQQETLAKIPGCPPQTRKAVAWLAQKAREASGWPEAVILSLRAEGAYLIERGGHVQHCPKANLSPKDETGAADALVGTFLALWLNGEPMSAALRCACAAAGLVASEFGAQEFLPSAREVSAEAGLGPDGPEPALAMSFKE